MSGAILGISAFYHDSAAALLLDGHIVAAAQEERFSRKKHDESFPSHAVRYVLAEAGIALDEVELVAFYDKPFVKFERLLETYHALAPRGLRSFLSAMPVWIKEKLFTKRLLRNELRSFGKARMPLIFPEHHLSHGASAFYPSPFEQAAILTIDGVGEWATCTIGHGQGNHLEILRELRFPHSVGLLYSAFTYYTGFRVNSGEYKLMGLAPYGMDGCEQVRQFQEKILDVLVDVREDGSLLLNMDYFDFATGLRMTHDAKWAELFGIPRREPESEITQEYMNMALAIQRVTEDIVFKLAATARQLTGCEHLVLAGGVSLNSVANGKLQARGIFDRIWIQPAAGDAGGALGAAFCGWHISKQQPRQVPVLADAMSGAYLGPEFDAKTVARTARRYKAPHRHFQDVAALCGEVARLLADGKVVGWFQGRMEFGPRALGNRSILGDARNPEMQKKMNLKIKFREGFRPFAPSVLEEDIETFFELDGPSPYMLLVVPLKHERRKPMAADYAQLELYDRLYHLRSDVPAITHVDFSARIQSVNRETNPRYWQLLNTFKQQTGYGILVNTSFNVRGEPIVCTPDDAFRCFMRTEMDYLVMGDFLFDKAEQDVLADDIDWREEFQLD
jgi:carbamoyltransferase